MNDDDREFWMQIRRGLLLIVGAIERHWGDDDKPPGPKYLDAAQNISSGPSIMDQVGSFTKRK